MAIQLTERNSGRILEARLTGELVHEDYQRLVPDFERLMKAHGKIRTLFVITRFHGWKAAALRDHIKFDPKHCSDIERLVILGNNKWGKA